MVPYQSPAILMLMRGRGARSAFTDWSTTEVSERVDFLNRISGLIKDRSEELAEIITAEVGTPIEYSRMAMVGTPRVVSRSYAKILDGYVWEEEVRNSLVIKEPIGVAAMIPSVELPTAPDNRKGGACYSSGLHNGAEAIQGGAPECVPSSRYPG
ncbi:MAG: hypothetical protein Ct9H90mP1_3400 [Methanobacteriota archaeon]|nr:MAG: hypothetical protein Ct9H90mP1_3400 [Euryarchaeota archaeon]